MLEGVLNLGIAGIRDINRNRQRNLPGLDRPQEPVFALSEKPADAANIFRG